MCSTLRFEAHLIMVTYATALSLLGSYSSRPSAQGCPPSFNRIVADHRVVREIFAVI